MTEDFSSESDRADEQEQDSKESMLLPITAAIASVAPMAFGCFLGELIGGVDFVCGGRS